MRQAGVLDALCALSRVFCDMCCVMSILSLAPSSWSAGVPFVELGKSEISSLYGTFSSSKYLFCCLYHKQTELMFLCPLCYFLNIILFIFLAVPCGVWDLVPPPGMEPKPPAVEVQHLNHWTSREVPPLPVMNIPVLLQVNLYCLFSASFLHTACYSTWRHT